MTSIALRRLGHNVRIFERSSTPLLHDQGAGIVAGGDTQEFLDKYDKTKTCPSVTSRIRLYLDRDGSVTQREHMAQQMTSWDLLYHVNRANFDNLKTDYVQGSLHDLEGEGYGLYKYGRQVTGLADADDQVKVTYKSTLEGEDHDQTKHDLADFVIIADGASSAMRKALSPSSTGRSYAGYVAFRGTVPEGQLSVAARAVFVEKFPFYHSKHIQILAYAIPGRNGTVAPGSRLINWVWYWNVPGDSDEYREVFTDKHGAPHRWTLPPGNNMDRAVWQRQRQRAAGLLPPQFAELVAKTASPFVQAITDLEAPADGRVWLLGGKAVLVGDAVAGFRPHTAASTSQAAFHALTLPEVFAGKMSRDDYEQQIMRFATGWQMRGVMVGNRSQFGL